MVVFYKNFNRTERTLLSISSVRQLFPTLEICCLNLYINDENQYEEYAPVFKQLQVKVFVGKKRYNFTPTANVSKHNGLYFTEGINKMFELSKNHRYQKVFMLDEDCFFTTGETIRFLLNNDFDLAYGSWPSPQPNGFQQINGSSLALNIDSTAQIFPLPERTQWIENLLGKELHNRCVELNLKVIKIPTRTYIDFGGDGVHTNNIDEIRMQLRKHGLRCII